MKKPLMPVFVAVLSLAGAAHAQTYPAKAVRVVAGFAPGGSTDLTARIFARELNKLFPGGVPARAGGQAARGRHHQPEALAARVPVPDGRGFGDELGLMLQLGALHMLG